MAEMIATLLARLTQQAYCVAVKRHTSVSARLVNDTGMRQTDRRTDVRGEKRKKSEDR